MVDQLQFNVYLDFSYKINHQRIVNIRYWADQILTSIMWEFNRFCNKRICLGLYEIFSCICETFVCYTNEYHRIVGAVRNGKILKIDIHGF